jgi:hypothetical protein
MCIYGGVAEQTLNLANRAGPVTAWEVVFAITVARTLKLESLIHRNWNLLT